MTSITTKRLDSATFYEAGKIHTSAFLSPEWFGHWACYQSWSDRVFANYPTREEAEAAALKELESVVKRGTA